MANHKVAKGECLIQIAEAEGFFWNTLWTHPKNAELAKLRGNPNVLLEGDSVFIPEKKTRTLRCHTGMRHEIRIKGIPAQFVMQMLDAAGSPRVAVKYKLDVDGKKFEGETDAEGRVIHDIPAKAKKATLEMLEESEDGEAAPEEKYEFDLGHLDPVTETPGLLARLKNLGLYEGEIGDELDDEAKESLRTFQTSQGIEATGEPDDRTRAALVRQHGS